MPRIIFLLGICPLCLCKKPLKGFWLYFYLFFFFWGWFFHFFPLITRSFPDHFSCRGGSEHHWDLWAVAEQRVQLPVAWVLLKLLTPLPVSANTNPCPSLSASPEGLHYHLLSCFSTPQRLPCPSASNKPRSLHFLGGSRWWLRHGTGTCLLKIWGNPSSSSYGGTAVSVRPGDFAPWGCLKPRRWGLLQERHRQPVAASPRQLARKVYEAVRQLLCQVRVLQHVLGGTDLVLELFLTSFSTYWKWSF